MNNGFFPFSTPNPVYVYPNNIVVWYWQGKIDTGAMVSVGSAVITVQPFNTYGLTSSTTIGCWCEYVFILKQGVYKFDWLYHKLSASGIHDIYLDKKKIVTGIDAYAASPATAVSSTSGVTVTFSGEHVLRIQSDSKNASSSAYGIRHTLFAFQEQ